MGIGLVDGPAGTQAWLLAVQDDEEEKMEPIPRHKARSILIGLRRLGVRSSSACQVTVCFVVIFFPAGNMRNRWVTRKAEPLSAIIHTLTINIHR